MFGSKKQIIISSWSQIILWTLISGLGWTRIGLDLVQIQIEINLIINYFRALRSVLLKRQPFEQNSVKKP